MSATTRADFDFWLGEWSVQNRILGSDGQWENADRARVRITPFLSGKAVLEEWVGPFFGETMCGFSIRTFDPSTNEWHLVLFWTTNGDGGFSELRGQFRHGRGEFFSEHGDSRTRYTFSDVSPTSLRWDRATSKDVGMWHTDWVMEFTRTAAASEDSRSVFDLPWTTGHRLSNAAQSPIESELGLWVGVDADGREVKLSNAAINNGALVVQLHRVRSQGSREWVETVAISGYVSSIDEWQCWTATSDDPQLRRGTAPDVDVTTLQLMDQGPPSSVTP